MAHSHAAARVAGSSAAAAASWVDRVCKVRPSEKRLAQWLASHGTSVSRSLRFDRAGRLRVVEPVETAGACLASIPMHLGIGASSNPSNPYTALPSRTAHWQLTEMLRDIAHTLVIEASQDDRPAHFYARTLLHRIRELDNNAPTGEYGGLLRPARATTASNDGTSVGDEESAEDRLRRRSTTRKAIHHNAAMSPASWRVKGSAVVRDSTAYDRVFVDRLEAAIVHAEQTVTDSLVRFVRPAFAAALAFPVRDPLLPFEVIPLVDRCGDALFARDDDGQVKTVVTPNVRLSAAASDDGNGEPCFTIVAARPIATGERLVIDRCRGSNADAGDKDPWSGFSPLGLQRIRFGR